MSQNINFSCCFELPTKKNYLSVTTAPQYDNVDFTLILDDEHSGSICLREKQVDELINILQDFKRSKAIITPNRGE